MSERRRDGSRITIRPIEPDDREALAAAFERLSPQSRYRRVFAPMAPLSERALQYLTCVAHHDHEALVATDAETGGGVGVARYVRTGPEVAEPAIAVVDDWQGRGLGGCLLDALADRARDEGIRRFEAPVLASTDEALHLLARLGQTSRRTEGREIHVTIELPAQRGAGDRWRALLRHVARGSAQPVRTLLGRLAPRRRGAPDDRRRNVIVVGTDGSDHAAVAVEAAGELAGVSGATLEVVGAHRFFAADQAPLEGVVRDASETLRARGL